MKKAAEKKLIVPVAIILLVSILMLTWAIPFLSTWLDFTLGYKELSDSEVTAIMEKNETYSFLVTSGETTLGNICSYVVSTLAILSFSVSVCGCIIAIAYPIYCASNYMHSKIEHRNMQELISMKNAKNPRWQAIKDAIEIEDKCA